MKRTYDGPRVYLAGPFFNTPQIDTICRIEQILDQAGLAYYSPMRDSPSAHFSPEDRKDFDKWTPVFQQNIQQLHECCMVLAVVAWATPPDQGIYRVSCRSKDGENVWCMACGYAVLDRIEIPDSGTVYEMGYARAIKKPVIGFHPSGGTKLNLMLSHGAHGMITDWANLAAFFIMSAGSGEPVRGWDEWACRKCSLAMALGPSILPGNWINKLDWTIPTMHEGGIF